MNLSVISLRNPKFVCYKIFDIIFMATKTIGALFDLDGVILDTEGTYTQFWAKIDQLYPTNTPNFAQEIKGSNLQAILHTYFNDDAIRDEITKMLDEFQQTMEYKYFDGAMEFIEHLNDSGIPCCVVTSSDNRKMEALYEQKPDFKRHFDKIVTGDMVSHPKPNPECFQLGAGMIGVPPCDCYVFEDSINGLEAGLAAGSVVIGLATTNPYSAINGKSHKVINDFMGFTVADMLAVKKP